MTALYSLSIFCYVHVFVYHISYSMGTCGLPDIALRPQRLDLNRLCFKHSKWSQLHAYVFSLWMSYNNCAVHSSSLCKVAVRI